MGKVMSATGHRPDKLGGYKPRNNPTVQHIKEELYEKLRLCMDGGFDEFWSGAAQGFDQIFFEVVEDLRVEFPHIKNNIAIPYKGFGDNWPEAAKKNLDELCKLADVVHIVCEGDYDIRYLQKRNVFMVDKGDAIMSCWDGTMGGTFNCIEYAKKKKKPILRLNPRTRIWNCI